MAAADDSVTTLEVIPIVISGLALAVSVLAAWRTDRRSVKSEQRSREMATHSLWSDAIEATIRVSDPTHRDAPDLFQTLGVRLIALIDALPHWDGLDTWLSAELLHGAALRRQIGETLAGNPTQEAGLKVMAIYADWVQGLSNNLRHMRNTGFDRGTLADLEREAAKGAKALRDQYGWPEPGSDSALRPLKPQ